MSEISKRITIAIKASGLSHRELESKTGIPHSAIQRYAAGTTDRIPISRLEKLAVALGTTAEYLLGWETKESPSTKMSAGEDKFLNETTVIYHRNGKTVKKEFTKEQMEMLIQMIEAIPEKPKDI